MHSGPTGKGEARKTDSEGAVERSRFTSKRDTFYMDSYDSGYTYLKPEKRRKGQDS